jgi:hypothetical protein
MALLVAGRPGAAGAAEGESAPGAGEEAAAEAAPADPGATAGEENAAEKGEGRSFFDSFRADPTLGGKVHFTYRLRYLARFNDFKSYELPFPPTADEEEQIDEMKDRRKDTTDQDLEQYLSLRVEDAYRAEEPGFLTSLGGEAAFRWFKDIDASKKGDEHYGFQDAGGDREEFQIQTLFARVRTFDSHLELLLGRQFGYEAEWLHFDGGTGIFRGLSVLDREVELAAYGGSRVTYFPGSSSAHDGIAGGHIKAWLFPDTRLKLSDIHYIDNTFEAELRHDFTRAIWAAATYRMVNEDPHSVLAQGWFEIPEREWTIILDYVGKLGRNADDFNFDYTQSARRSQDSDKDRHFNIGDLEPYDEVSLEARKGFRRWIGVSAGGVLHRLRERDREDNYNTDWQEAWAGVDLTDPFWAGLTGRLTLRYIHTDLPRRTVRLPLDEVLSNGLPDFQPEDVTGDGEPSSLGLEFLLEQDFERVFAVGLTSAFRAYDYRSNYLLLDDLRAASVGGYVRWKATPRTEWLLGYSYDTDYRFINPDLDAVHTVRAQFLLRW